LQSEAETTVHLLDDWFDPIEAGLRDRVREFIQAMIESELEAALVRPRYGRRPKADPENADGPSATSGYRHGHRSDDQMSRRSNGENPHWQSRNSRVSWRRIRQGRAVGDESASRNRKFESTPLQRRVTSEPRFDTERRFCSVVPEPHFDEIPGGVYLSSSQAGPGNDINAG
jgi:hypothetical protein